MLNSNAVGEILCMEVAGEIVCNIVAEKCYTSDWKRGAVLEQRHIVCQKLHWIDVVLFYGLLLDP